MKIAIVGEKARASAWEKHLRKLSVVSEVIITTSIIDHTEIDALLLIDDSEENLYRLNQSIKAGNHTYLISKLPLKRDHLETVYHTSEEAGVTVQFSHWPTYAESMNWIYQELGKPELVQIKKEIVPLDHRFPDLDDLDHNWIDELALIIKWLGGNIHQYEVKPVRLNGKPLGMDITLRFENRSLATIQFFAGAEKEYHQRLLSSNQVLADCNISEQVIRLFSGSETDHLSVRKKAFDPKNTAERSVIQFIKSIQLQKKSLFSPYDALQTAIAAEKIRKLSNLP
jgi:hypothetical protein